MYTHVQHYQQAAAGLLRAKRLKLSQFEAYFRKEMLVAKAAIKATKTTTTIWL